MEDLPEIGKNVLFVECALCPRWNFSKESISELVKRIPANLLPVSVPVLCSVEQAEKSLAPLKGKEFDSILVFACGVGAQVVSETLGGRVIPLLDTKQISKKNLGKLEEYCEGCDNCNIHETAGICVKTRCPKHLLNGPCESILEGGMCEAKPEMKCVWVSVYEKMKRENRLSDFVKVREK